MQHSVLSTTNIKIDRHPRPLNFRIDERCCVMRIEKSEVIPATACPLRHGVRFSFVPHTVNHWKQPFLRRFVERWIHPTMRLIIIQLRKIDRQIRFRDRLNSPGGLPGIVQLVKDWKGFAL